MNIDEIFIQIEKVLYKYSEYYTQGFYLTEVPTIEVLEEIRDKLLEMVKENNNEHKSN